MYEFKLKFPSMEVLLQLLPSIYNIFNNLLSCLKLVGETKSY